MRKHRLLVVDDTKFIRDLLVRYLELDGHEVYEAESGEGLVERLMENRIELMLLDVNMPGPDLLEILEEVRKIPELKKLPIILVSGSDDDEILDQAYELGVKDFIQKPPNFHLLRSRVAAYLAQSQVLLVKKRLRDAWGKNILQISRLAEGREPDTKHHIDRIQAYCEFLVNQCRANQHSELSEEWVHSFVSAAPLHDIGKSQIPDSVLLKRDKLTPSERKLIESHSLLGVDLASEFLADCANSSLTDIATHMVRSHHERWDGKGYPDGHAGEEIPLAARLLSVCDVYDALRSRRPYRDGLSHRQAVEIIQEGKGTQFDPSIVDVFAKSESRFGEIHDSLAG